MSSGGPVWRVSFSSRAKRELGRLDPPIRSRVLDAIQGLRFEPPVGDITRLTNSSPPQWRLRIGGWRVRFTRDEDAREILIVHVLPRGRAYRD